MRVLAKSAVLALLLPFACAGSQTEEDPRAGQIATFFAQDLDSIAWTDGDAGDIMYGVASCDNGITPDAATRFPGDTTTATSAWYCGDLDAADGAESTLYDAGAGSSNLPAGARLTPGGANDPQAVDAGIDGASDGSAESSTEAGLDASTPALALLNELEVNPPGTDDGWEFVELRGAPNGPLVGVYLLAIEGDVGSGTDTGVLDFVVDLGTACAGPCAFGANGLLYMKSTTGHPSEDVDTPVLELPAFDEGLLENGTSSYFLVWSPTALTADTDLDADDDGALELPAGALVLDSLAWSDGDVGDILYGSASCTPTDGTPDAVTRLPSDTSTSSGAWYCGDLAGSDPDVLAYDTATGSALMPAEAVLTPGAANDGGSAPDAGTGSAGGVGGAAGMGGAAGTGGTGGTSGGVAGTGGTSGSTGTGASSAAPAEEGDSGCSCRASSQAGATQAWFGLLAFIGFFFARRSGRSH